MRHLKGPTTLEKIYFVLFDAKALGAFEKVMAEMKERGGARCRRAGRGFILKLGPFAASATFLRHQPGEYGLCSCSVCTRERTPRESPAANWSVTSTPCSILTRMPPVNGVDSRDPVQARGCRGAHLPVFAPAPRN